MAVSTSSNRLPERIDYAWSGISGIPALALDERAIHSCAENRITLTSGSRHVGGVPRLPPTTIRRR
jgi:hypothetical protein